MQEADKARLATLWQSAGFGVLREILAKQRRDTYRAIRSERSDMGEIRYMQGVLDTIDGIFDLEQRNDARE